LAFAEGKGKTSDPGNFTFSVSLRLAICKTGLWLPTSRLVRRKGENLKEQLIYNGTLRCITPGLPCTGEGNGTPLQYSCLENPMDRGAW